MNADHPSVPLNPLHEDGQGLQCNSSNTMWYCWCVQEELFYVYFKVRSPGSDVIPGCNPSECQETFNINLNNESHHVVI